MQKCASIIIKIQVCLTKELENQCQLKYSKMDCGLMRTGVDNRLVLILIKIISWIIPNCYAFWCFVLQLGKTIKLYQNNFCYKTNRIDEINDDLLINLQNIYFKVMNPWSVNRILQLCEELQPSTNTTGNSDADIKSSFFLSRR